MGRARACRVRTCEESYREAHDPPRRCDARRRADHLKQREPEGAFEQRELEYDTEEHAHAADDRQWVVARVIVEDES